jgi:hypothetical protein
MTVRKWAEDYLFSKCLSEVEAKEVVHKMIQGESCETKRTRWDETLDKIPTQMLNFIRDDINKAAIEYMKTYLVGLWRKPFFDGTIK